MLRLVSLHSNILLAHTSGIIRQGDGYTTYGSHKKDAIVAVNLTSNRSAVGVGMLAKSSADLYLARNAGIGVKILHVFGDKLWNLEPSVTLQLPNAGATMKAPSLEEFPSLGDSFKPKKEQRVAQADASTLDVRLQENASDRETNDLETKFDNVEIADDSRNHGDDRNNDGDESDDDDTEKPPSEDEKLKQAFLTAIKKMGKNPAVPLLTSNFYRCHILTVDSTIDIKHTSYKKLSKFLQEMAARNYLTVKEETKGVEKIVAFNTSHPDIVNVVLSVGEAPSNGQSTTSGGDGLFITEMKEVYIVTRDVMHFFNAFDVKCGEGLEPAQVKKYVKEYVCKHKLQDPTNIRTIRIDDVLKALCGTDEATKTIPFEELLMHVTNKMEHKYAMCNRNELKTGGKTSTIKMTLAKRSGNKTVTLIDHLEMFGIRLPEFAQACKIGVAASTSIIRPDCPANANKGQLLVQGNQIRFVYKLLTETYKIPPKYINGMELAKKEKKAKKK